MTFRDMGQYKVTSACAYQLSGGQNRVAENSTEQPGYPVRFA